MVSSNNKIPRIADSDGPDNEPISLFELGAILIYLAEKIGSQLLSEDPRKRAIIMQLMMNRLVGVGPLFGQVHHFLRNLKELVPCGQKHFGDENNRLYTVMDDHLEGSKCFAGDDYTIFYFTTYPWVVRYEWHQIYLDEYENLKRKFGRIRAWSAVQKGVAVPFLN